MGEQGSENFAASAAIARVWTWLSRPITAWTGRASGATESEGAFRRGYQPSGLMNPPPGYEEQRALWRYYPRRGADATQWHGAPAPEGSVPED